MERYQYGNRSRGGSNNIVPVRVGDELEVTIEAVGAKGDGIAKKNGFVIFVPNTKKDEKVRVKITKVLRKVSFAEVVGSSKGESSEEVSDGESQDESSEDYSEEETSEEGSDLEEESEDFGEEDQSDEDYSDDEGKSD